MRASIIEGRRCNLAEEHRINTDDCDGNQRAGVRLYEKSEGGTAEAVWNKGSNEIYGTGSC